MALRQESLPGVVVQPGKWPLRGEQLEPEPGEVVQVLLLGERIRQRPPLREQPEIEEKDEVVPVLRRPRNQVRNRKAITGSPEDVGEAAR